MVTQGDNPQSSATRQANRDTQAPMSAARSAEEGVRGTLGQEQMCDYLC